MTTRKLACLLVLSSAFTNFAFPVIKPKLTFFQIKRKGTFLKNTKRLTNLLPAQKQAFFVQEGFKFW